jgi:hypothetical protein
VIYTPKYFKPQELLDPETFNRFGAEGLRYFRPEILTALDFIRENYPTKTGSRAITVNNYATGGQYQNSGLRGPSAPEYKRHSAHSFGAAIDFRAEGCAPEEMRAWILRRHEGAMKFSQADKNVQTPDHEVLGIRRMEIGTTTWVHIDCLEHDGYHILMVNP